MNEKKGAGRGRGADGLKQKGFYAALYSCVGVMLVLAIVIGYMNFGRNDDVDSPDTLVENTSQTGLDEQALVPPLTQDEGIDASEVSGGREPAGQHLEPAFDIPDAREVTNGEGAPADFRDDEALGTEDTDYLEAWRKREAPAEQPTPAPVVVPETPKPQAFKNFDQASDSMMWPIVGDIVMNYSVDHLIYDKTLEQYRTNDSICISSPLGQPVVAAADGVVKETGSTRESGRTVVVDHGNGWRTTYSQLQDEILVKVGDVVTKNQSIGTVGIPSLYSSQLGSHLEFTVQKDLNPVDPKTVLK